MLNNGDFCLSFCNAACCGNIPGKDLSFRVGEGSLTEAQLAFLVDACVETGTTYYILADSLTLVTGISISGPCPFLDDRNMCTIHDDPLRPDVCGKVMPGGQFCNSVRHLTNQPTVAEVLFCWNLPYPRANTSP